MGKYDWIERCPVLHLTPWNTQNILSGRRGWAAGFSCGSNRHIGPIWHQCAGRTWRHDLNRADSNDDTEGFCVSRAIKNSSPASTRTSSSFLFCVRHTWLALYNRAGRPGTKLFDVARPFPAPDCCWYRHSSASNYRPGPCRRPQKNKKKRL